MHLSRALANFVAAHTNRPKEIRADSITQNSGSEDNVVN
jgi:hypothetical protein